MLNLKFRANEKLHIGDNITLQFERRSDPILRRCGILNYRQSVSVAISAPTEVVVLRNELIRESNATG